MALVRGKVHCQMKFRGEDQLAEKVVNTLVVWI